MRYLGTAIVAALLFAGACGSTSNANKANSQTHSSVVTTPDVSTLPTLPPASTEPPSTVPPRQDIQVSESGFTQLPPDSANYSYLTYAVILKNPNATQVATGVSLNIALYNAAGAVVGDETPTVSYVGPNDIAAVGDSSQVSGVVRIKVQALVGTWSDVPSSGVGRFTVSGVNTVTQQFGGLTTTGTVKSTFAKDLKQVYATALYRNGFGKLIGGAFTFLDFVPAGGSTAFKISGTNAVPGIARTDVVITPSSLSLIG